MMRYTIGNMYHKKKIKRMGDSALNSTLLSTCNGVEPYC